jgi:hypothetical protein
MDRDSLAAERRDCPREDALNRNAILLHLPADKGRTVIFDQQLVARHSHPFRGWQAYDRQQTIRGETAEAKPGMSKTMVKILELAIAKAASLPEAVQERLGRELLEHVNAFTALRADIEIGLRELDAGLGEELDIEDLIRQAREGHARRS